MPPARIVKMKQDLAVLPVYFARKNDIVAVEALPDDHFTASLSQVLDYQVDYRTLADIEATELPKLTFLHPWGWSPSSHLALAPLKPYCDETFQSHPVAQWSDAHYEIYGKGVVVDVLPRILERLAPYQINFIPQRCASIEGIEQEAALRSIVVKAPWSGAGKGVRFMHRELTRFEREWSKGVLKQQGFVTVATLVEKVHDFAMQFYIHPDGAIEYLGISLFFTNEHGAYVGNHVMSQPELYTALKSYLDDTVRSETFDEEFATIRDTYLSILPELIGRNYCGYFGIDMMLIRDADESIRIHPMVEINLRCNMGILSSEVYNRIVHPAAKGRMIIDHAPSAEALRTKLDELKLKYPMVIHEGKVQSGFFALTPVCSDSLYCAYLILDNTGALQES